MYCLKIKPRAGYVMDSSEHQSWSLGPTVTPKLVGWVTNSRRVAVIEPTGFCTNKAVGRHYLR